MVADFLFFFLSLRNCNDVSLIAETVSGWFVDRILSHNVGGERTIPGY